VATGPELLVQSGPFAGYPTGTALVNPVGFNIGNEDYFLGRVDYTLSANDSLFFRYVSDDSHATFPFDAASLPYWPETDHGHNQFFTAEERHIFSPTLINSVQFSAVRVYEDASSPGQPASASDPLNYGQLFAPGQSRYDGDAMGPGLGMLGPTVNIPFTMIQNRFTGQDNVAWSHGAHSLKAGVSVARVQANLSTTQGEGGWYQFGSLQQMLEGIASVDIVTPPSNSDSILTPQSPIDTWRYFRETPH
jgi:hypothetical protein